MTVTISGTDGITTPGLTNTGTETLVNLTTTGNTTLGDAAGDTLTVTGGTTTFTQGTANGVAYLNGSKVLTTGSALTFNGSALAVTGNTTSTTVQIGTNPAGVSIGVLGIPNQKRIYGRNAANSADVNVLYVDASNGLVLGPSDAAVIDASGNLLVGATSFWNGQTTSITNGNGNAVSNARNKGIIFNNAYSNATGGIPNIGGNCNWSNAWGIGTNSSSNDNTLRFGTITYDTNGAYWAGGYCAVYAGAYTNASDYRMKENVVDYSDGALGRVLALRPVTYNIISHISEDSQIPHPVVKTEIGFIAHEIQEHVPEVVSGVKDAVNEDGSPIHQGVDYSKFTAVLVKAIQEQQALITTLTDRITALEAK